MRIYYHGDFDGIASAIIFSDFFINHLKRTDICWQYMSYYQSNEVWAVTPLDGTDNAVLDFPFNLNADWWFDHHHTSLGSHSLEFVKNHKSKPYITESHSQRIYWDFDKKEFYSQEEELDSIEYSQGKHWKYVNNAPSVAQVISEYLEEKFSYKSELMSPILKWANIIDAAQYESVEQANDLSVPFVKINSLMEYRPKKEIDLNKIIRLALDGLPIEEIVARNGISQFVTKMDELYKNFRKIFENNYEIYKDVITCIVTQQSDSYAFARYYSYLLKKDIKYHVVMLYQKESVAIRVGTNPFIKIQNPKNVAEILQKYGGGGHAGVGAVVISNKIKARKIFDEIIGKLNEKN
jgi:oligoribonuclease NrnB/cAMP/cGMP phosphodiesterase (DHH superfamily)